MPHKSLMFHAFAPEFSSVALEHFGENWNKIGLELRFCSHFQASMQHVLFWFFSVNCLTFFTLDVSIRMNAKNENPKSGQFWPDLGFFFGSGLSGNCHGSASTIPIRTNANPIRIKAIVSVFMAVGSPEV